VGGHGESKSDAKLDLAKLCGTATWENNVTVRIEVIYEFEQSPNITAGQFVDTNHGNRWQPGFFHNSGVKIENLAEIQIYDTASLLDALDLDAIVVDGHEGIIDGSTVTISHDPANDIEAEGKVLLQHTGSQTGDWHEEHVNQLISGIPYGVTRKPAGITTYTEWLKGAPMGGQTMTIDVSKDANGEYDFSVTINGHSSDVEYHVVGSGTSDAGMLYLQSHWGSGVRFTSAKVKKM
jgi:hypothetical protein